MKKTLKLISLCLMLAMMVSAFAACSGNGEKSPSNDGEKITYWTANFGSRQSQTIESFNELMYYQEVSKATGIDVEFIHPSMGAAKVEAFQILMASGDFPDIIEYGWKGYAGGPDQAIADGVIISLNEYLEEYAPNFYEYMEGKKGKESGNVYRAGSVSEQGNYFGFTNLAIGSYSGFAGLMVRKDKLDEWGLDVPVTIDDWENLLKTAKENGFSRPLTGENYLFDIKTGEIFNTAWRIGKHFYLDGKTVKFGPFETAYREYIEKMASWMKAGYVDIDFITNDSAAVEGYMTNGAAVACYGYVGGTIGKLLPAMADKDPNYDLVACPFPVLKEGEIPFSQEVSSDVRDYTAAITVQCGEDDADRYKTAITWCDYLYSEEGMLLKFFGVEGDTYTKVEREDGTHYVYTDKIYDHEKEGAHSVEAALYKFMRPGDGPGFSEHPDYLDGFYPYEQQKEAIKVWNEYLDEAKKMTVPPLVHTSEEAAEIAKIQTAARSDLDAAISNIILGKQGIDTLDAAIAKAKENGYDRLIEIKQTAYNRYLELIK